MGAIGCPSCGHIACVCDTKVRHDESCKHRRAVVCPVPIECDHGYDVCPECDPCTCMVTAALSRTQPAPALDDNNSAGDAHAA